MGLPSLPHQTGFSLLELMASVTLAGTLSAAAISHLHGVQQQATHLSIDNMAHSLEQAAQQAWSRAILTGVQHHPEANIELQNQPVRLAHGYPAAALDGMTAALHPHPLWQHQAVGNRLEISLQGSPHDCHLIYHQPARAGDFPVIEKAGSDC